jgi:exodeoxyribonuclease V alpha subunit
MSVPMLERLKKLKDAQSIASIDYYFAKFIAEQSAAESDLVVLAAALVSYELGRGNVCVDLTEIGTPFDLEDANVFADISLPASISRLLESLAIGVCTDNKPMILDGNLLYLNRYWHYQEQVAKSILSRCVPADNHDQYELKNSLDRLFAGNDCANKPDWQKVAAALAVRNRFTVISGGPGTGKTTTVARLLAMLVEMALLANQPLPLIKLVAPTGKAAARLTQSIKNAKLTVNCSAEVRQAITENASTIHRLLGVIPDSPHFRHNAQNPLLIDCLVVDEASMVDLPLMAKLLQSLPDSARVILLGDKDQLASVEAGSVLGDICGTTNNEPQQLTYSPQVSEWLSVLCDFDVIDSGRETVAVADSVVNLQHSYRFDQHSGIGVLANAVNRGDVDACWQALDAGYEDLHYYRASRENYQQIIAEAVTAYADFLQRVARQEPPLDILRAFDRFRLLCVLKEGGYGVYHLNEQIEQALRREGLIDSARSWYPGRPVMITQNDYSLGLFNGDVGVALFDESIQQLQVNFIMPDGTVRRVSPGRLPVHETVYAMTVHKSQGSEFDAVLLVLPENMNPVLSRELLYTGITRARKRFFLYANDNVMAKSVVTPTRRVSGLRARLWANH